MKYDLYDFDGTIYDGDSGVDLVKFAIKKNPKFLLKFPAIILACIKYALKIGTKEQAKNIIFSFLKDVKDVDAFVKEFWEKIKAQLMKSVPPPLSSDVMLELQQPSCSQNRKIRK